jgi:hypothetical protein
MLRIRRLYFYLVLYVSVSMLTTGLATLIRVLLERLLDIPSTGFFGLFMGREQTQEQTALGIALVILGLPVWALHWRTVQKWLTGTHGVADRTSALRRLYVYGVLLTTAFATYSASRDLIENLLALALGQTAGTVRLAGITGTLPFVLIAGFFWFYHWHIAAVDRGTAGEDGASATLRRWYVYPVLVFSAMVLTINLAWLGQRSWEVALDASTRGTPFGQVALARTLASSGATVLVALVFWLGHQAWSQGQVAVTVWHGDNERHSVLRQVHLYGLVLVTVAWGLANASEILRFGVANVLGVAPASVGGVPVVVALGGPLANTLVFGAFWAFYWRALQREAITQAEVGRQAAVRRLYFYVVSAIALGFAVWSVASLLRLAGDMLLQPAAIDPTGPRAELARDLSWLLIGLPVWLLHWSPMQARTTGERGLAETRATTRRWYLYIVAFAGVAALLFSAGRVVYEAVLVALGRAPDPALVGNLSHALTDAIVAGSVLWYHWFLVMRADLAVLRQVTQTRLAVAVVSGLDAVGVTSLQDFVHASLGCARIRIYWTDQAHLRETSVRVMDDDDSR